MRQKQFPKQRQSNRKSRFSTEFTRIIFTDDYTAARFGGHSSPLCSLSRHCNLTILLFLHRCQFYVFHCGANSVPLPFASFSTCNKRRKSRFCDAFYAITDFKLLYSVKLLQKLIKEEEVKKKREVKRKVSIRQEFKITRSK